MMTDHLRLMVWGLLVLCASSLSMLSHAEGRGVADDSDRWLVMVDDAAAMHELGAHLDYIEDAHSILTIDKLINNPSHRWTKNITSIPNFGYSSSTYWFRISVKNSSSSPLSRLLSVSYPLLDQIDYYQVNDGKVIDSYETGDLLSFQQRPIAHRHFVFPVTFPVGESHDIYFRVQTSGALQFPATLWNEQQFFIDDQAELIRISVFYGILLVMVVFNLFLFFSLKESTYLYYVLFVSSFLLVEAALHGITFQYLWPGSAFTHKMAILLSVPSCVLFTSLFSRRFLSLSEHAPKVNLLLKSIELASIINMLMAFFLPYRITTTIAVVLVIVVCSTCMVVGPYLWRAGHKIARLFTIAWICMMSSAALLALNKFGILPYNFVTENAMQLGLSLQVVLLSLALADRLNIERKARWVAQKEMLEETRQRHQIEDTMIYEATHNHLTRFPNRVYLDSRFSELVSSSEFDPEGIAVLVVHFNRFHEINKTIGHLRADQLLKTICMNLNISVRDVKGIVKIERDGQHQYDVAMLEGVSAALLIDRKVNADITHAASDIIKTLQSPVEFDGLAIDTSASIGVAYYPEHGKDIVGLLSNCMIAIDVGLHKNQLVTEYSDDINPYSARRLTLMGDLSNAVNNDLLELYFQPQVGFKVNKVSSIEALLRWNHPLHGFVPPDEFIPIAETTGTINKVTEWVLDKALEKVAELKRHGHLLSVAVNISAVNLKEKDFPDLVKSMLYKHDVEPKFLVLEVTETAMMEDPENALIALTTLNQIGVKLSIDDFGTGHSSLAYIKKLPVHEIKIDRSFVMDMDTDKDDSIIVKTTVNMCHDLDYEVVAEGVETIHAYDSLKAMGCDYIQGYYLARPLPFNDLLAWLEDSAWSPE